ncbi:uncharacterized protein LOC135345681 isoform X2 [Halichondria panicea]|uniref:uncharacterized protein LOC135345681 isoform X2 n=1 Tax=Halichondria panicea TaxID=6063 RepID=UPI00312B63F3
MNLNSPTFEGPDFQVVRKKTRHSSRKGQPRTRDVSKFIQSALVDHPSTSDPLASPSRPSKDKQNLAKRAAPSGVNSSSRKKAKKGSHDWNQLFSEVKWPGLDEGEENFESSDIESYSDNDPRDVAHLDSADIVTDSDGAATDGVVEGTVDRANKWRRTMDLLHTSTLRQQSDVVAMDYISDFESNHTSDNDTLSPPYTPPNSTLHTPPTHKPTLHSTDGELLTSTPPISPEANLDHTLCRPKTSDWLKGVSLDTDATSVGESDLSSAIKTPLDSAKKIGSRRGRRRYVEGGLAEQLERVVQREGVEVTFWEHRVKTLHESDVDTSSCLTVQVLALVNCYSLFVASCHLTQGNPSLQTTLLNAPPVVIVVLFSLQCAKSLNLRAGSRVRIHPPWQCLSLSSPSQEVVLCALFCQPLEHAPSLTMPTSPVPCKLRGSLSVSSHLTSPVPDSSALTLSPVKSLLLKPAKDRHPTPLPASTASSVQATKGLPEVPTLLLDAIEHAQCGMVGGVTGRVVRVYRRKRQQLIRTVQNDHKDNQPSTARRTLLYSNKIRGSKFTWCLLLCDAAGLFSEIQLPQQLESEWSGLVETGEREVVHFTDLKLLRRANNTRSPELISLISSLKLYPPLSPLVSNSQTTFSAFPPSFCYILQASVTSLPLTASQGLGEKLPSLSRESQSPTRLDLLGRVLYYGQEYSKKEDSTHLQKLHSSSFGGYLHLLTPSALTPSPPTHPDPTLVTVYLKASFSIDGLEDTLSTPGAELLLRDVCRDSNGVAGLTIDACALIVPLTTSMRSLSRICLFGKF